MIYFIPMFSGLLVDDNMFEFKKNVCYELSDIQNKFVLIYPNDGVSYYINFYNAIYENNKNQHIVKSNFNKDIYIFAFANYYAENQCNVIKFNNKEFTININNSLKIYDNEGCVFEDKNYNFTFSHTEKKFGKLFLHFIGVKKYVIIIDNDFSIYGMCYDEVNIKEKETLFLKKLRDSLNHGKVLSVKAEKIDEYLVYLDNFELKLKNEFVHTVFLDCVKAKNFKYAKSLLCDSFNIKAEALSQFFPDFDNYYAIENAVFMFKKNTLTGIYQFEIENLKISNIIDFSQ